MFGISSVASPELREVTQEQVVTVFAILEEWFQAMENGTAHHRLPDPNFVPSPGRPAISEALVEEFISQLDREIDTDAFDTQGRKYGADASCEFNRLAYPQRLALVQQLMGALLSDEEMAQKVERMKAQQSASLQPEDA